MARYNNLILISFFLFLVSLPSISAEINSSELNATIEHYMSIANLTRTQIISEGNEHWRSYSGTSWDNNWVHIALFVIALILFFVGEIANDKWFKMMGGILIIVLSIYIARIGIYGFDSDFVKNSIIILLWGLGGYLIVRNGHDLAVEGW